MVGTLALSCSFLLLVLHLDLRAIRSALFCVICRRRMLFLLLYVAAKPSSSMGLIRLLYVKTSVSVVVASPDRHLRKLILSSALRIMLVVCSTSLNRSSSVTPRRLALLTCSMGMLNRVRLIVSVFRQLDLKIISLVLLALSFTCHKLHHFSSAVI